MRTPARWSPLRPITRSSWGPHVDSIFGTDAQRSHLDHYRVASVARDPKYDFEIHANDAAVLTLARRASEQPVPIIGFGQPQLDKPGVVGTIFGGTNKVSFQGRLSRSHRLKPGRYTLYITAVDSAGVPTEAHAVSFTIAS